jgi:EpsI family protein
VLPLGYLYFAIPLWDLALQPLQNLTVAVVSTWIRIVSVPAFIDGNLIHLPSGNFEVMEGCAGLRYAIVALALAAFAGLVHHRRWPPRAVLLLSAFALALLGNWVRVFVIVVVGYVSEMQHFLVADDHILFGWAVFLVFMLPLFFIERRLDAKYAAASPETDVATAAARHSGHGAIYASCVLLAVAIWGNLQVAASGQPPSAPTSMTLPSIDGWNRAAVWQDMRRPRFFGAAAEAAGWYIDAGVRVGVYVAQYDVQRQAAEVIFSQNRPAGESAVAHEDRTLRVPTRDGREMPFRELSVANRDGTARLVWIAMRVAGTPVVNGLAAKGLQLLGALRGRRDAQVLVLTAQCSADCGDARAALMRYAGAAADPLFAQAEQFRSPAVAAPGLEDEIL